MGYRFLRLLFGLRFSPFILMLALYMILMQSESHTEHLKELKKGLYELEYMDNLAWTTDSVDSLEFAYRNSLEIFKDYGFCLQQFHTNFHEMQTRIDREHLAESEHHCKLFGLMWVKEIDKIKVKSLVLDQNAKNKRSVLGSLNSVFDLFGICLPVLNRARLFLHKLQMSKDLDWDSPLSNKLQKEWQNIVKQVKNCPVMEINRSCGPRSGSYDLICFTDVSKNLYSCVLYLRNVSTKEVTFIQTKNKVVSEQLKSKTMPVLELVVMQLGVQSLMDAYNELQNAVRPVSITSLKLFSDSIISLSWVEALVSRFEKMRGRSVFVMNKLESIRKLCQTHSVEFCYIPGSENPADYTTREVSSRVLSRTCFHTGPHFLQSEDNFHNVLVL